MTYFFVIPVLVLASATMMYALTGKKEIFKFDLVQFVYAFVVSPVFSFG